MLKLGSLLFLFHLFSWLLLCKCVCVCTCLNRASEQYWGQRWCRGGGCCRAEFPPLVSISNMGGHGALLGVCRELSWLYAEVEKSGGDHWCPPRCSGSTISLIWLVPISWFPCGASCLRAVIPKPCPSSPLSHSHAPAVQNACCPAPFLGSLLSASYPVGWDLPSLIHTKILEINNLTCKFS